MWRSKGKGSGKESNEPEPTNDESDGDPPQQVRQQTDLGRLPEADEPYLGPCQHRPGNRRMHEIRLNTRVQTVRIRNKGMQSACKLRTGILNGGTGQDTVMKIELWQLLGMFPPSNITHPLLVKTAEPLCDLVGLLFLAKNWTTMCLPNAAGGLGKYTDGLLRIYDPQQALYEQNYQLVCCICWKLGPSVNGSEGTVCTHQSTPESNVDNPGDSLEHLKGCRNIRQDPGMGTVEYIIPTKGITCPFALKEEVQANNMDCRKILVENGVIESIDSPNDHIYKWPEVNSLFHVIGRIFDAAKAIPGLEGRLQRFMFKGEGEDLPEGTPAWLSDPLALYIPEEEISEVFGLLTTLLCDDAVSEFVEKQNQAPEVGATIVEVEPAMRSNVHELCRRVGDGQSVAVPGTGAQIQRKTEEKIKRLSKRQRNYENPEETSPIIQSLEPGAKGGQTLQREPLRQVQRHCIANRIR